MDEARALPLLLMRRIGEAGGPVDYVKVCPCHKPQQLYGVTVLDRYDFFLYGSMTLEYKISSADIS